MGLYTINHDPIQIIAGTNDKFSAAYTEATTVVKGDKLQKSLNYLRSFANSIDKLSKSKNLRDPNIAKSAGDIEKIKDFDTMTECIKYLDIHLPGNKDVAAIKSLIDNIIKLKPLYTEGYKRKLRLVEMEYESAVIIVIHSLSVIITSSIEIKVKDDGVIEINKVNKVEGGLIKKMLHDLDTEISKSSHKGYLDELLKVETKISADDTKTEAVGVKEAAGLVGEFFSIMGYLKDFAKGGIRLTTMIIQTAFGIIPIIRSIMYLYYKRKADISNNLLVQAEFIKLNIEQLKNNKNIDEAKKAEIIKKQEAYVIAYQKKANKLRAELVETERQTVDAIKEDDKNIGDDGDYSL